MTLKELLPSLRLQIYAYEYTRCETWWNYKQINSPFTRLFYITAGEGYVSHSGHTYKLKPGKMILIPPFTSVDYHCPSWLEQYYMLFTAKTMTESELFTMQNYNYILDTDEMIPFLFKRLLELNPDMGLNYYNPNRKNYNSSILNGKRQISPENEFETYGILRTLIAPFIRTASGLPDLNLKNKNSLLKALLYMNENIEKQLSLKDIAKKVSLHPTYFSDSFKKYFGERPIRYLNSKRIEKAQLLLKGSDMTIKEIAFKCGFNDFDYFFRVFRKYTDTTPCSYRQKENY